MNSKFVLASLICFVYILAFASSGKCQTKYEKKSFVCDLSFRDEKYLSSLLNTAIAELDDGCVKQILATGINPNLLYLYDKKGSAPIVVVSGTNSRIGITKMLLKAGVDVKSEEAGGALYIASTNGNVEVVEVLLEAGVSPNGKNFLEGDSLIRAASRGYEKIVEALLKHGADVNAVSTTGATALMGADDNPEIVTALIKAGAKIETTDKKGWSAIFYAVKYIQTAKLKILLQNGAKINLKDEKGISPLILAEQIKDTKLQAEIIKLLKCESVVENEQKGCIGNERTENQTASETGSENFKSAALF